MTPGDICLAWFPYGDVAGMKLRPVLVLTELIGPGPELLTAYITSGIPRVLIETDLILDPKTPAAAKTNLKVTSVLRLHKLSTIHKICVVRSLGRISAATEIEVASRLRAMLNL